jgi:hypothetical protein
MCGQPLDVASTERLGVTAVGEIQGGGVAKPIACREDEREINAGWNTLLGRTAASLTRSTLEGMTCKDSWTDS